MAGIGFDLRRAVYSRTGLLSRLRSYSSAGLISSGPWIMTIVGLATLDAISGRFAGRAEYELFRGLVTYAFCFSLIAVGGLQMAVTRRIADLLYAGRHEAILPAFNVCVLAVGAFQAGTGALFCVLADLPLGVSVAATVLYTVIGLTWMALVWLNVTREHDEILRAFLAGLIVIVASVPFLDGADAATLLTFFTAGQTLTLAMLARAIVHGLACHGPRAVAILDAPRRFPAVFATGLAYNAAIWADKIVLWVADGTGPHPWVRFHQLYDPACFLAYLTAVPALAVNLVRVETTFYERYREYYGAILGGHPLASIERLRGRMIAVMNYSARRLMRAQAALSLMAMVFAPQILAAVGMPPEAVPAFRAACLGAYFHVMLLITLMMQMYFDLRREALATSAAFLVLNLAFGIWSAELGPQTYGLGYAAAAMLSLLVAFTLLRARLRELEYLTFSRQQFPAPAGEPAGAV